MIATINARQLRKDLAAVVKQVGKGQRFSVLYRSRVAFEIVPPHTESVSSFLQDDPLFNATAVGRSDRGRPALEHDQVLYA